jgi:hypothetical protein
MSTLRYRYQTIEFGDIDIHLRTLRNRQEYSDDDGVAARLGIHSSNWSLYGAAWASGEMLARRMLEHEIERGYSHQQGTPDDVSTLTQPLRGSDKFQVHRYTRCCRDAAII